MSVPQNPTSAERLKAIGTLMKREHERHGGLVSAIDGKKFNKWRGTAEQTRAANVVSNGCTSDFKRLRAAVKDLDADSDFKNTLINTLAASQDIITTCWRTFQFQSVPSPAAKIDSTLIKNPGGDFAHVEKRIAEYPEGQVSEFEFLDIKRVLFVQKSVKAKVTGEFGTLVMDEALKRFGTISCACRGCTSPELESREICFKLGGKDTFGFTFLCGEHSKDKKVMMTFGAQVFMS